MNYSPTESYDAAKYTLRALLPLMSNAEVFDEEGPDTVNMHGLQSWATRVRQRINDTEVSWHIVGDEDGLVDISRSVSFLTPSGQPINHTTLLRTLDMGEMTRHMLSSFICQLIIGVDSVPMASRKEHKEWVKVATEDANYTFRTGLAAIVNDPDLTVGTWQSSDLADRFAIIHAAAEKTAGRGLGRHKELWTQSGVIFDSSDVYYDAWYEESVRLMGTITPRMLFR